MAITITDFEKTWASTSPLTPYSFSESNYKEGWNFIGSTPPARQMWDYIQNFNDLKMKYIVDNFLPLSGGTMTGAVEGNPLTLTADDGNGNSANLVLGADGSATWNGNNIVTDKVESAEISASPIGTGKVYFHKFGRICMVTFDNANNIAAGSNGITAGIPAGFEPIKTIQQAWISTDGSRRFSFNFESNGNIVIYNYTSAVSSTFTLYAVVVYITAS